MGSTASWLHSHALCNRDNETKQKKRLRTGSRLQQPLPLAFCRLSPALSQGTGTKTKQLTPSFLVPVIPEAQLPFLFELPLDIPRFLNKLPLLSFLVPVYFSVIICTTREVGGLKQQPLCFCDLPPPLGGKLQWP